MQEQQTRTSAQILADLHAALGYQGTKDAIARRVIEHPTELRMQAARQIWLGLQIDLAMIEQAESELSRISYAIRSGCGITDEQAQEFTVGMCCDFNETLLRALHFYRANLRRQS